MDNWVPEDFYGKGESFDYFENYTRDRIIHNEEESNFPPNPYAMANAHAGPSVEIKSVEDVLSNKNIETFVQYSLRSVGIKSNRYDKIDSSKTIKQPLPEIDVDTFSGRPILLSHKYLKSSRSEKHKNKGNFDPEEVLKYYNDPNLSIEQKCRTLFNSPNDSLDKSQDPIEISSDDNVIEITDDSSQSLNSTGSIAYQRLIPKSDKYINHQFNSSSSSTTSVLEESNDSFETPDKKSNQTKTRKGRKCNYKKMNLDFCDNHDKPNITPPGFQSVSRNQLYLQKARFN